MRFKRGPMCRAAPSSPPSWRLYGGFASRAGAGSPRSKTPNATKQAKGDGRGKKESSKGVGWGMHGDRARAAHSAMGSSRDARSRFVLHRAVVLALAARYDSSSPRVPGALPSSLFKQVRGSGTPWENHLTRGDHQSQRVVFGRRDLVFVAPVSGRHFDFCQLT